MILTALCSAQRDIALPLSEPVRGVDGKLMHQILVPKGTSVFVGAAASNTNKALWGEDAYEWKPERWLEPLPEAVLDAKIPGVYANLWVSCALDTQMSNLTGCNIG